MAEDQIDPDIASWVLEFLIRQPIKDSIFNSLVRVLPISETNYSLKKLILLRRLESQVPNCLVSENVLQILEQIYELDQILGSKDCDKILGTKDCEQIVANKDCDQFFSTNGCDQILGSKDCDQNLGSKGCEKNLGSQYCDRSLGSKDCEQKLGSKYCYQSLASKGCEKKLGSKYSDNILGSKDCCELLRKVYCAVAVECTVGCLRNGDNDVKGEFFDVVKRVWRRRVREMEGEDVGLVSEDLLEWRDDIEAAVWDESVCLNVVERSKEIDAVEAVRMYLKEEKARMGPSFLELVTDTLKSKEGGVQGAICSRERDESDQCRRNDGEEPEHDNNDRTYEKGKAVVVDTEKRYPMTRRKHVARKRSRLVTSCSFRGAKITDVDESGAGPSCSGHLPGTPEIKRVKEALETSRLELHAVVKDPLPEALLLAESVISVSNVANKDLGPPGDQNLDLPGGQNRDKSGEANVAVENMDCEPPGDQNRSKYFGADNVVSVQSGVANAGNSLCSGQINAPKGLMERNKTAHTFEWDDWIDHSSDELSDSSNRPHLSSPRQRRVSPLNIYKEQKLAKRRKKKRWSIVEEDTLRAGIWKRTLEAYLKCIP
ncbi:hypothetical protein Leryth_012166 [Lithospermum erythrorhizon]|nr:hypothetical protein Leryth_012166 [Lithospermum erythrorhizon]